MCSRRGLARRSRFFLIYSRVYFRRNDTNVIQRARVIYTHTVRLRFVTGRAPHVYIRYTSSSSSSSFISPPSSPSIKSHNTRGPFLTSKSSHKNRLFTRVNNRRALGTRAYDAVFKYRARPTRGRFRPDYAA